MSALDEKAKKLVPFWTFTSRNLPMQISEMWTKPKVYAWYNSFVRNFGVDPVEFTPEYFESVGAFNTGETMPISGLPLYLQPDLPQVRVTEDVDRFTKALQGENIGQVLSDFNPFFTAPIEYMTGTDLFTGRQYDETDWTKAKPPRTQRCCRFWRCSVRPSRAPTASTSRTRGWLPCVPSTRCSTARSG